MLVRNLIIAHSLSILTRFDSHELSQEGLRIKLQGHLEKYLKLKWVFLISTPKGIMLWAQF